MPEEVKLNTKSLVAWAPTRLSPEVIAIMRAGQVAAFEAMFPREGSDMDKMQAPKMAEAKKPEEAPTPTKEEVEEIGERLAKLEAIENVEDFGSREITNDTIARAWKAYQKGVRYECEVRTPQWNNANADLIRQGKRRRRQPPWYLLDYVPAHVRILAFRRDYPEGVFLVDITKSGSAVMGLATVYASREDCANSLVAGQGRKLAEDIERAETGAISRALGFLGYGAVAAIAEGEDVRDAHEGRTPKPEKTNAEQADELRDRMKKSREHNKSVDQASEEKTEADDLRRRLAEFVGRKRIFSLDEIEDVFGPIDAMGANQLKGIGRKLRDVKTSANWKKLAGQMKYAKRWDDALGGSDLEQLKSYLFELLEAAPESIRGEVQSALDEAAQLVPFDDVQVEGVKILAKLDETTGLDTLERFARERGERDSDAE